MQTGAVVSNSGPPRSKLTGGQKWMIAGLLLLQIPSGLIFYSLAAVFAITGIFVPISMALMGIGTLPFTFAMQYKARWRAGEAPHEPIIARQATAAAHDRLAAPT